MAAFQSDHAGRPRVRGLALHRAMRARNIHFILANAGQRQQGRNRQHEGDEKHRTAGEQITACAHHGRRYAVAERRKSGVASQPLADLERPHQAEADRGDRRP